MSADSHPLAQRLRSQANYLHRDDQRRIGVRTHRDMHRAADLIDAHWNHSLARIALADEAIRWGGKEVLDEYNPYQGGA